LILTDREIQIGIERGSILIEPRPLEVVYSSTSVDLTLDPIITELIQKKSAIKKVIDPTDPDFDAEENMAEVSKIHDISGTYYDIPPNNLHLGWTAERVDLRHDPKLAARVEGKSSLARLGLAVHMTAPTIHAGFNGRIRLEIVNFGTMPIRVRPGMRICQLVFEQTLGTPQKGYHGQFANQTVQPITKKT